MIDLLIAACVLCGAAVGCGITREYYIKRMEKLATYSKTFDVIRAQTIVDLRNELSKYKHVRDGKGRFLKRGAR